MKIYKLSKNLLFIGFFLLLSIILTPNYFLLNCDNIYADNKLQYAKIVGSNVKLYRTTSGSEDISNIFFTIPKSYYVLLRPCDNDDYYSATYIDEEGFVKKNEIQCVKGIPSKPFADNISFRVFIPSGVDMRSSPIQSEGINHIASIQYLETNLKFYGIIDGEQVISHRSSEWYYAKYYKNGSYEKGYIYSVFCDLLTDIPENLEMLEYIDEADFDIKQTTANVATESEFSSLPSITQIIIIVAVSLPCIFIIYLLFKPTKITSRMIENAELKSKKKPRKIKRKDYYEYQE